MKHLAVLLLVLGPSASSWAANLCNETVPSDRMVDGIPAYQQCTDSTNADIYSNNGVDTAASSGGSGWTRTQFGGGYQCTELAHRYLSFKWAVKSVPNGNAGVWCDGSIPSGLEKTTTPVHGDLIVFAPGSCGADQTTGHVAVVDVVNTNTTVTFVEQNRAGRRSCASNTAACFLHATANGGGIIDGGALDGPAPDSRATAAPDSSVRPDRPAGAEVPDSAGALSTGGALGAGGALGHGGNSSLPTGSGGATATASGGAPGSGGQTTSGGTTVVASAGGTGGSITTQPTTASSSGCACRLGDLRSAGPGSSGALLLLLAGFIRPRRRRR
jgi:surface antigen